jgi:hypothetical protein
MAFFENKNQGKFLLIKATEFFHWTGWKVLQRVGNTDRFTKLWSVRLSPNL